MRDPKWDAILSPIISSPEIVALREKIKKARETATIFPAANETFEAFGAFKYDDLKIVILGPEPYNTPGLAHGLSFSSKQNVQTEETLTLFQEIHRDIFSAYKFEECFKNNNLFSWAAQGILLLNVSYTVESNKKLSHQNWGWEYFTTKILEKLNDYHEPIVFILMSSIAHPYGSILTNATEHPEQRLNTDIGKIKHLLIKTTYPNEKNKMNFIGCGAFGKALQFLSRERANSSTTVNLIDPDIFNTIWEKIKQEYRKEKIPLIHGPFQEKVNIFEESDMKKQIKFLYPYYQILNLTT